MFLNQYFAWAWTPYQVKQLLKQESRTESGLILPATAPVEVEASLCYFSVLRNGLQYSWLWLFETMPQAVALRLLPQYLEEDDPIRDLIESTIPNRSPGEPAKTFVQVVPGRWFIDQWDLDALDINEIWLGFDYRQFIRSGDLKVSTDLILGADEFVAQLRRSAKV